MFTGFLRNYPVHAEWCDELISEERTRCGVPVVYGVVANRWQHLSGHCNVSIGRLAVGGTGVLRGFALGNKIYYFGCFLLLLRTPGVFYNVMW